MLSKVSKIDVYQSVSAKMSIMILGATVYHPSPVYGLCFAYSFYLKFVIAFRIYNVFGVIFVNSLAFSLQNNLCEEKQRNLVIASWGVHPKRTMQIQGLMVRFFYGYLYVLRGRINIEFFKPIIITSFIGGALNGQERSKSCSCILGTSFHLSNATCIY